MDGCRGFICGSGCERVSKGGTTCSSRAFGEVRVFHRPHPSPGADKGGVASARKWLELYEVKP